MLSEATREATRKALDAFVAQTAELAGPALHKIILFGSWARNEATDESDVDVLVVMDEDRALKKAIQNISFDLLLQHGVLIAKIFMSPERYEHTTAVGYSLMEWIQEEGKVLHEQP